MKPISKDSVRRFQKLERSVKNRARFIAKQLGALYGNRISEFDLNRLEFDFSLDRCLIRSGEDGDLFNLSEELMLIDKFGNRFWSCEFPMRWLSEDFEQEAEESILRYKKTIDAVAAAKEEEAAKLKRKVEQARKRLENSGASKEDLRLLGVIK